MPEHDKLGQVTTALIDIFQSTPEPNAEGADLAGDALMLRHHADRVAQGVCLGGAASADAPPALRNALIAALGESAFAAAVSALRIVYVLFKDIEPETADDAAPAAA